MNPEDIREVVGAVIPPKDPKHVTATKDEIETISKVCPFYGPIVKGRVPGVEGSDQFLDGVAETFCRIWRTLTEYDYQSLIEGLQLADLQEADERLSKTGTGMLEAEYPMIDMHVPEQDSFGGGVRAAYGIIEFAIEKRLGGIPIVPTVGEAPLDQTREPVADEFPDATNIEPAHIPTSSDGVTAGPVGYDNTMSGQPAPPAKVFVFTAVQETETNKWLVSWPVHGTKAAHLHDMVRMMASLFGEENAAKIELTTADNKVVCYFSVGK